VQHAEQPKQNDDGDRDADQPEQNAAHWGAFPLFVDLSDQRAELTQVPSLTS
jgi:hypothetical protein